MLSEGSSTHSAKELHCATAEFSIEDRGRSWRHFFSTFAILLTLLVGASFLPWWPVRLVTSIVGGLTLIRAFILYHDFLHGAILHGSRFAGGFFYLFGLFAMTPLRCWRTSHNFHHAHVGKIVLSRPGEFPQFTSEIGAFPLMTSRQWRDASFLHRLRYRVSRHPLTFLFAYLTIFLVGNCLVPLIQSPRKYWDNALAIAAHAGLIAALWMLFGVDVVFFAAVLPVAVATTSGAYLFYVQHTYPSMQIMPLEKWTYEQAALSSSTYLQLGPVVRWLTGNIGYHHVHHVNSRIPFYYLPAAMASIPALQHPLTTTLHPFDIYASFRANLWDADSGKMISYSDAKGSRSIRVER